MRSGGRMTGWAVGLMTGTVLDGNIDVALLRTDGRTVAGFGAWALEPAPDGLLPLLFQTLEAARAWNFDGPEPAVFAQAEEALTRAQAAAVQALLDRAGIAAAEVEVVGFHGQTVLHRGAAPGAPGATRQLGDGALMARILGIPVAWDFRSADVAAGGQGAPLAPVYHRALLAGLVAAGEAPGATAVLNLGGVGNITWSDGDRLAAFDTGPANAPINDFMRSRGLGPMDRDGRLAGQGRVDEARLAAALDHPYLSRPFPKSLDRFDFGAGLAEGLSDADGAATLTAFSCACVGRALDLLPSRPARLAVCGGGRRNQVLMRMLAERAGVAAVPAEELGWRGDAIEAECFAFLAQRVREGLPISFPETTGAPRPLTGGRLALP